MSVLISLQSFALDIEVYDVRVQDMSALLQKITGEKIIHIGKQGNNKISLVLHEATNKELLAFYHETLIGGSSFGGSGFWYY